MSVTRNYARHLRVITVLQTITLQLRIVTRKVRNYGVITHFTHLQRNAGSVTRNSHTLIDTDWVWLQNNSDSLPQSMRMASVLPHIMRLS